MLKPLLLIRFTDFCQGLCFWAIIAWLIRPHSGLVRIDQHCSQLPSFAMWLAFPTSDYYEVVYLSPAEKSPRRTRQLSREQKGLARGLSWHPSGPLSPGDALEAGHAGVRRPSGPLLLPFPTPRLAHTPAGCGHGGTRKSSPSRRGQTGSVSPAASASVQGRHGLAEPVPLVGRGWGHGTRRRAWGKQQ